MSYHSLVQQRSDVALREGGARKAKASEPAPFAHLINGAVRGWILNAGFPCVGAKSAVQMDSYRLGTYESFDAKVLGSLADDLRAYIDEYSATPSVRPRVQPGEWLPLNPTFASFLACFKEAPVCDEVVFERQLWAVLEGMRRLDKSAVPAGFSTNPSDDKFAFCFGGEGFFVAAFHPGSWRWSRRFMFPLLVFNMHRQFDALKGNGRFARMRDQIRSNDNALQGAKNDLVGDFGEKSEAVQYALRRVAPGWKPPGFSGN